MSAPTSAQYKVNSEFLVLQLSKELHETLVSAINEGDAVDFSDFDDDDVKILANFNVVGPAEIQA